MITAKSFQKKLLAWFDIAGRKDLPWQINKTPYRVWISEIMLQQTQVSTVIEYYLRFMQSFPDVAALANAHEDDVLHHWAGLGYYSRARNLHRAAKMIVDEYMHELPNDFKEMTKLPGIGASTAGAILSIAFKNPTAILDGNVKRVLSRLHGIQAPIDDKKTEQQLWEIAKDFTPEKRIDDYTQAIMDLGATVCTPKKTDCNPCPMKNICVAHKEDLVSLIPLKKAKSKIPSKHASFLIFEYRKQIFLQKRPKTGIWSGLWSLPEIKQAFDAKQLKQFCRQQFQLEITEWENLPEFRHTFSHYHLHIAPVLIKLKRKPLLVMEAPEQIWYNLKQPQTVGLPKPIKTILEQLT